MKRKTRSKTVEAAVEFHIDHVPATLPEHSGTTLVVKVQHGVEVAWDNLGGGWRISCDCGWESSAWERLGGAAEEFDDHLDQLKAKALKKEKGKG